MVFVKDQSSLLVSVGVSQHMHEIGRLSCGKLMEEKIPLSHEVVCFQMLDFGTSNSNSEVSKSNSWKITSFLENYATSEGAVSHYMYVLYYQQLSIACFQVSFYSNNNFE